MVKFNLPTFANYDLQLEFYEIKQTRVTARSKEMEEGRFCAISARQCD